MTSLMCVLFCPLFVVGVGIDNILVVCSPFTLLFQCLCYARDVLFLGLPLFLENRDFE